MTQPPPPTIRSGLPINADHGAGQRVPRIALTFNGRSAGCANRTLRPANGPSATPAIPPDLAQRRRVTSRTDRQRPLAISGTLHFP
jgi:hypothetical protein